MLRKQFIKRKNHLYSSESDLDKIVSQGSKRLKTLYPEYAEEKVREYRRKNGIYSDESCLEKISSQQYRAASSCKSVIERDKAELQKRLVKRRQK